MNLIPRILQILLLTSVLAVPAANAEMEELSLPQLEQRRMEIDAELGQLARFTLRSGTGAVGSVPGWGRSCFSTSGC